MQQQRRRNQMYLKDEMTRGFFVLKKIEAITTSSSDLRLMMNKCKSDSPRMGSEPLSIHCKRLLPLLISSKKWHKKQVSYIQEYIYKLILICF